MVSQHELLAFNYDSLGGAFGLAVAAASAPVRLHDSGFVGVDAEDGFDWARFGGAAFGAPSALG
jgi:hypothetical protein